MMNDRTIRLEIDEIIGTIEMMLSFSASARGSLINRGRNVAYNVYSIVEMMFKLKSTIKVLCLPISLNVSE